MGAGLIPVVDQVLDVRDFAAHLYYMIFEKDHTNPMRWVGLGLTAIGAVPFVGSIVKGLGKLAIFQGGAKAVASYAEPLLDAIRQINPEWADIGTLKAALDSNWGEGVTASKQLWQDLLANIKGTIGNIPTPPDWVWGLGRFRSAKDDVLGTISEIQSMSDRLLEEAMGAIKHEVDQVLDELDRIARGGDGELVPAGAGGLSPNRMETEPLLRGNEPLRMQVDGTPGGSGSVPNFKATLGDDVFNNLAEELTEKQIQDLVAQHGADLVKWLGTDLKGNAVQDVLTRLTPNALNDLQDISGQQVKRLLDKFGDSAVETLAPSLKGKGLDELSRLGMFKFDPAKQALLDAGQGQTVRNLPVLKGKTRAEIETILTQNGFTPPNVGKTSGQEMWLHPDGSVVRMKLGPAAFKNPKRPAEHLVREISRKQPASSLPKDIFAKVAENGNLIPAGPKFAKDQLQQWFRKQTGKLPSNQELDKLMDIWGDAAHIDFRP